MMDSAETVMQQPVSSLPDLISNGPNSREGLASVLATSSYPAQPPIFHSTTEAADAGLAVQETSIREASGTLEIQGGKADEITDGGETRGALLDENISVETADDTCNLADRTSDAVVVQKIKETVDIEVEIPPAGSRSEKQTVVEATLFQGGTGHVQILIEQAGGKSNAEGIAVEVVLNEPTPDVSREDFVPLAQEGDLGGDPTSGTSIVEAVGIEGVSSSVAKNGDNSGFSVEVETRVGLTVSRLSYEEAAPGAEVSELKELNVCKITELEQEEVEGVPSAVPPERVKNMLEIESSPALPPEDGVTIEEPRAGDDFNTDPADPLVETVSQLGTEDASIDIEGAEEAVVTVAASEEALNASDDSTVANLLESEQESLAALKSLDDYVDSSAVSEEALNASDPVSIHVKDVLEETTIAAELDNSRLPERKEVDSLVNSDTPQPILRREDVDGGQLSTLESKSEVIAKDRIIVVEEDDASLVFKETMTEDLGGPLVVPTILGDPENALNADDPSTFMEIEISAVDSSIVVELDASCVVTASEDLDSLVVPKAFVEGLCNGSENPPLLTLELEDGAPAFASIDNTEQSPASVSAFDDSSDLVTPGVQDTSAIEPSIMEELGATLPTTDCIPTTEATEQENPQDTPVVDNAAEMLPIAQNVSLTETRESSTAIGMGEGNLQLLNSEEKTVAMESSLLQEETTNTLGSSAQTETKFHVSDESSLAAIVAAEKEICTQLQTPADKVQEDVRKQSTESTEEAVPRADEDASVIREETIDTNIATIEIMVVEKDIEMENASEEAEGGEFVIVTEALSQEGALVECVSNPSADLVVAMEEMAETTIDIAIHQDGNDGTDEDVDAHGVLIGVGSSVEASGLTITEIAGTTVIVAEYEAQKQLSARSLSEPLITPPAEEIAEAINALSSVGNVRDTEPLNTEGLLVVTQKNADSKLNISHTSSDGEIPLPVDVIQRKAPPMAVLLDELNTTIVEVENKNPTDTIVEPEVGGAPHEAGEAAAEPLTLKDDDIRSATEMETSRNAALDSPLDNKLTIDFATTTTKHVPETAVEGHQDTPPISEVENVEPGAILASTDCGSVEETQLASKEALDDEAAEDPESVLGSKSIPVSVSISLENPGESAMEIVEQVSLVSSVDEVDSIKMGEASDVVASSANGSGVNVVEALDSSLIKSPPGDVESVVDGLTEALDASSGGEALEKNEKKRGREEEDAVAEDIEKTSKTARTCNGEVCTSSDVEASDVQIEEDDEKVDKKRSRDELETVEAESAVSLQTKLQKTGSTEDDTGILSRQANAEECVDMEVKEQGLENVVNGATQEAEFPRYKKRKIALFLGYSGAGYQGMQKNPGAITIEGELEEALFRAGAISESNYGEPKKLDWRRAARTDKGVSAVGQVVSGTFFIDPPGFIERVNSHLPKQIRVYGYKRVTASFNAKKLCDRRKYEYVLPVYAFDPSVHLDRESAAAQAAAREDFVSEVAEEDGVEKERKVTGAYLASAVVEPVVEEIVGSIMEATNSVTVEIDGKDDNQSGSNAICTVKEEVTVVTETVLGSQPTTSLQPTEEAKGEAAELEIIGKDIGPVGVLVPTHEVLTELIEVTVIDPVEDPSTEQGKESLDAQTQEELIEQKEVTMNETDADRNLDDTKEVTMNETEADSNLDDTEVAMNETDADTNGDDMKDALDEKVKAAEVEVVMIQKQEELSEQKEVPVSDTVEYLSPEEKKEALGEKVKKSTFKFGDAEFTRLNRILGAFAGHHNFHNFTARTKATDPSANRYIVSFEVEKVFTVDGMEFVRCVVVGQSFMLHQIRKMIGLAVAIMRGTAPESILADALKRDTKINVPMAPELGLFLEECFYSSYNRKFRATHEEMSLSSYATEVNDFKREFIYPHIVSTEGRDATFAMWLHSLNDRHFPDLAAAREKENLEKSK